jgi:Zn-dependent protease with chaperone function
MPDTLYPPSPRNVPANFTEPGPDYRTRVVLVLGSLILFFLVYVGLLVGSALLFVVLLVSVPGVGWLFCLIPGTLFLFLLKGFFKRQRSGKSWKVEITAREQPRLFQFIERLCGELGAPFPHRVYVNPEVQAYVKYSESLLALFVPVPKNLHIGLGLVNVLNLSEFKAVLAHEFGHFSQRSMKLGQYVYVASRIIRDMVVERDWLDNWVYRLAYARSWVGLTGLVLYGIIFGLRKMMAGLYYAINFLSASLSREMEFNADLVAVSVTGSEAIIRGLSRIEFAREALEQAMSDLKDAADHDLYSADLFYHHREAIRHLRRVRKDPRLGEPPPLSDDPQLAAEVFEPDDKPTSAWDTHPSDYEREQNAKEHFVRCPIDARPCWQLFDDGAGVCERVTWRFYRAALRVPRDAVVDDAPVVQAFIDEEHGETTYDARYHGVYDRRTIDPGNVGGMVLGLQREPWTPEALEQVYLRLYGDQLKARAEAHAKRLDEYDELRARAREGDRERPVKFRGRRYRLRAVKELLERLDGELRQDRGWQSEFDREVFLAHYQMAAQVEPEFARELLERYEFHQAVQEIQGRLLAEDDMLDRVLAYAAGKEMLTQGEFRQVVRLFDEARKALTNNLLKADKLRLPALVNMTAGAPLGRFLYDKPLVGEFRITSRRISGKKIMKLKRQLGEVMSRVRRIRCKSLGQILSLQEEIARCWLAARTTARPAAATAPRPGEPPA